MAALGPVRPSVLARPYDPSARSGRLPTATAINPWSSSRSACRELAARCAPHHYADFFRSSVDGANAQPRHVDEEALKHFS